MNKTGGIRIGNRREKVRIKQMGISVTYCLAALFICSCTVEPTRLELQLEKCKVGGYCEIGNKGFLCVKEAKNEMDNQKYLR